MWLYVVCTVVFTVVCTVARTVIWFVRVTIIVVWFGFNCDIVCTVAHAHPSAELTGSNITVGKIYASFLLVDSWKTLKQQNEPVQEVWLLFCLSF